MEEEKKLVEKLSEVLKISTPGFQELMFIENPYSLRIKEVKIVISGAAIVTVNCEGDSLEQIVKDVMKAFWRMK